METVNDIINNLTVSMTLAKANEIMGVIDELKRKLQVSEDALQSERKRFDDYRATEDERERNRRMRDDETLQQRLSVLEKNENRNDALSEYLEEKARILNGIYERFKRKIGEKSLPTFKKQLDDAWNRFDKVQKEIANGNG